MNTEVHGFHWTTAKIDAPLNKTVENREWKVKGVIDVAIEGQFMDRLKTYESFMWLFPRDMLSWIVTEANMVLETHDYHSTTLGEILKFCGVLALMTRFQFRNRAALWKNSGMNK